MLKTFFFGKFQTGVLNHLDELAFYFLKNVVDLLKILFEKQPCECFIEVQFRIFGASLSHL